MREGEEVYLSVTGTHDIYVTGNYVIFQGDDSEDEEDNLDELDYDLGPDGNMMDMDEVDESEEDELDDMEDPRITEVESEEEPPKLVSAGKKDSKKRPAESEDEPTLDDLISKTNGEPKLSKKQAKKLKKNDGQAAAGAQEIPIKAEKPADKKVEPPNSDKKKVAFAKNLEQGPTGSPKVEAPKPMKKEEAPKGPRNVSGVTVDDKKEGKGKAAKKGDRVEMRYIGKLKDGKVFDCTWPALTLCLDHTLTIHSKQEGQALLLQAWKGRSHQGLGHRRRRHDSWWRTSPHHSRKPRIWQEGRTARHSF